MKRSQGRVRPGGITGESAVVRAVRPGHGYALGPLDSGGDATPGEPNELLRAARETAVLTQGQLAELANTQVEQQTGTLGAMDADYIGKLERGIHRWPNRHYRTALRQVLGYQSDADLGFFSTRSGGATVGQTPGRRTEGTTWSVRSSSGHWPAAWPALPSVIRSRSSSAAQPVQRSEEQP